MELLFTMVVPLTISGVALYGVGRQVDVYSALIHGAEEGLETLLRIVPALVGLLTAVSMLRASGALDLAAQLLSPLLDRVGVPSELLPLMLVRPISGSAALGVGAELIGNCGPDSYLGRVAAVMLGSTETTFYTIAVYFGRGGRDPYPIRPARRPMRRPHRLSGRPPGRSGCALTADSVHQNGVGVDALHPLVGERSSSRCSSGVSAGTPALRGCTGSWPGWRSRRSGA